MHGISWLLISIVAIGCVVGLAVLAFLVIATMKDLDYLCELQHDKTMGEECDPIKSTEDPEIPTMEMRHYSGIYPNICRSRPDPGSTSGTTAKILDDAKS